MRTLQEKIDGTKLDAIYKALIEDDYLSDDDKLKAFNMIAEELAELNNIKRLPGEEFKLVPETCRYFVSNKGRLIKITPEGEYLCNVRLVKSKTNRFYGEANLKDIYGQYYSARIHRIMAKTFIDPTLNLSYKLDKRIVNHIDNNERNNDIANIEILKNNGENILAAINMGIQVGLESRECYAKRGNVTRYYKSTAELIRDICESNNKGLFNHAISFHHKLRGWEVGYAKGE